MPLGFVWPGELGHLRPSRQLHRIWKPVWNILGDGDFELVLANAAHIKNVPGRKTDVSDAVWIADLQAHGLIVPEQMLWGRRRDNAVKSSLRLTPIDGAPLCRSPTTRAK